MLARSLALLLSICSLGAAQAPERYSIYKSIDGGTSWTRSDSGLIPTARINGFTSSAGSLFAATDAGIFSSLDFGSTWQPSSTNSGRITALALSKDLLYAGTDRNGLLISQDRGASWIADSTFSSKNVRSLLTTQGKVYAGTDADGVFTQAARSEQWRQLSAGLPPHAQAFSLATIQGKLFAGLYSKGLYVWNEPSGWSKVGRVTPLVLATTGNTLLAGHNPGGIHRSDDQGRSWQKARSSEAADFAALPLSSTQSYPPDGPVWEMATGPSGVFAGVGSGIFRSQDQGKTWTRTSKGLPPDRPGIAFLVTKDFVLAAVHNGSTQRGEKSVR